MTKEEIKELMFTTVQVRDRDDEGWEDAELLGYDERYEGFLARIKGEIERDVFSEMRLKPEPKKRLMTAQELVGKWLVHDNDGIHFVSGLSKDDLITPTFGPSTSSVEMFHILLWKWNDKPSLEGAKSLVVEE